MHDQWESIDGRMATPMIKEAQEEMKKEKYDDEVTRTEKMNQART